MEMSFSTPSRIQRSLESSAPWLFLSPHLDDAVLSCGALIEAASSAREVTVATIFTESGAAPHTRAARSFERQCSALDTGSLFDARRAEDREVLDNLGVKALHLGEADALYRHRRMPKLVGHLCAKLLPELVHRYPTYRFDIARGRISRGDNELISQLRYTVADLLESSGAELLFCPAGVGKHVDHLITRIVGAHFPEQVVFYSDFPYNETFEPDPAFLEENGLTQWIWNEKITAKRRLVQGYVTQADALFPDGIIPVAPETYFARSLDLRK